MRYIPPDLKSKLEEAYQTLYNNADPRMRIRLRKASRYISQGTFLSPIATVHEAEPVETLGVADIALQNDSLDSEPSLVWLFNINENGKAVVAVALPDRALYTWTELGEIAQAVDVAIEFDCRYELIPPDNSNFADIYGVKKTRIAPVTLGEPWLFYVTPSGVLKTRQGLNGYNSELATNVSKVSTARGWKSSKNTGEDQGLVVAYVKNNALFYRTYAEQPDGSMVWEVEREITTPAGSVQDVAVFRTNDFRVGFLPVINDQIHLILSDRLWVGMASPEENLMANISTIQPDLVRIYYKLGYNPDEHLLTTIDQLNIELLWASPLNSFTDAYNQAEDTAKIYITVMHEIKSPLGQDFLVEDNLGRTFTVESVTAVNDKQFILNTVDFHFSVNDFTVTYTGNGTATGPAGQSYDSFTTTFSALGIEPPIPPRVSTIYNIAGGEPIA